MPSGRGGAARAAEFSSDVLAGRAAQAQLLLDARRSNSALMAQGYAAAIVASFAQDLHPGRASDRAADPRLVQSDAGEHLVHSAWPGLHSVADHVAADQRAVDGARARTWHLRAIAGNAAAPGRDPCRQGAARPLAVAPVKKMVPRPRGSITRAASRPTRKPP